MCSFCAVFDRAEAVDNQHLRTSDPCATFTDLVMHCICDLISIKIFPEGYLSLSGLMEG